MRCWNTGITSRIYLSVMNLRCLTCTRTLTLPSRYTFLFDFVFHHDFDLVFDYDTFDQMFEYDIFNHLFEYDTFDHMFDYVHFDRVFDYDTFDHVFDYDIFDHIFDHFHACYHIDFEYGL